MESGGVKVKVIHRHRMGAREFVRVSELTYVGSRPVAVLSWFRHGPSLVPGFCVPLEADLLKPGARLRKKAGLGYSRQVWVYGGVTVDPRFTTPTEPAGTSTVDDTVTR